MSLAVGHPPKNYTDNPNKIGRTGKAPLLYLHLFAGEEADPSLRGPRLPNALCNDLLGSVNQIPLKSGAVALGSEKLRE